MSAGATPRSSNDFSADPEETNPTTKLDAPTTERADKLYNRSLVITFSNAEEVDVPPASLGIKPLSYIINKSLLQITRGPTLLSQMLKS